jgi:hypothetical protein
MRVQILQPLFLQVARSATRSVVSLVGSDLERYNQVNLTPSTLIPGP